MYHISNFLCHVQVDVRFRQELHNFVVHEANFSVVVKPVDSLK